MTIHEAKAFMLEYAVANRRFVSLAQQCDNILLRVRVLRPLHSDILEMYVAVERKSLRYNAACAVMAKEIECNRDPSVLMRLRIDFCLLELFEAIESTREGVPSLTKSASPRA